MGTSREEEQNAQNLEVVAGRRKERIGERKMRKRERRKRNRPFYSATTSDSPAPAL